MSKDVLLAGVYGIGMFVLGVNQMLKEALMYTAFISILFLSLAIKKL